MSLVLKVSGPVWEGESIFSESDRDLKISCRDGSVETHCHLLRSVSELISSLLWPQCDQCETFYVSLPDFSCKEVRLLLDILYSGEVSCNRQNLVAVHKLCQVLRIKPLKLAFKTESVEQKSSNKDRTSTNQLSEEKIKRTFDKTLKGTQAIEHNYENNSKSSGSDLKHCYICEVTVRGHHVLLDHLRLHDDSKGPFSCPEPSCPQTECSGVKLHKHFTENHIKSTIKGGRQNYVCDICNLQYKSFSTFKKHVQETHKIRPLKCGDCNQRFNDKAGLRTHIEAKHDKLKKFQCDFCHKNFSAAKFLYHHRREMHELGERREAKCDICGFISKGMLNLKKHMKSSHSDNPKKYHCTVCSKSFKSKYNLESHSRIHTGEAPYHCPGCDRRFKRGTHLRQHRLHCPGSTQLELDKTESSLVNVEILLDVQSDPADI